MKEVFLGATQATLTLKHNRRKAMPLAVALAIRWHLIASKRLRRDERERERERERDDAAFSKVTRRCAVAER
jgi:hypothetical protein